MQKHNRARCIELPSAPANPYGRSFVVLRRFRGGAGCGSSALSRFPLTLALTLIPILPPECVNGGAPVACYGQVFEAAALGCVG